VPALIQNSVNTASSDIQTSVLHVTEVPERSQPSTVMPRALVSQWIITTAQTTAVHAGPVLSTLPFLNTDAGL
jgi:hypothetical protein